MDVYEIVGNEVVKFWKETYPQEVVCFFKQKYDFDKDYDLCMEMACPVSDSDFESVEFQNDFNEGQTDVEDIVIVPFCDVAEYYYNTKLKGGS